MKKIFKQSINLFGKEQIRREVKEVWADNAVKEKNITFLTERKLKEKVIEHCKRIAEKEEMLNLILPWILQTLILSPDNIQH